MSTDHSQYFRTPKPRPIRPPKLHHATFMTLDVDAMVAWYELVAGLQPVYYSTQAAWLTNDEANHRIALLALPGTKPPVDKPHSAGLHHTAFEYDNFDEWLDNYERLRDAGIRPEICLDHGMTMSMYYADPDGNGVEIQVDMFGDWKLSKEWMWASQEFAADQIGPQFDPDKLAAARADGLSAEEIHERTRRSEYLPDQPRPTVTFDDPWPARIAADPAIADGVPEPTK
ncbi:extradiol dioxygenase [Epidermidibacterium keratini]|uniref:Extradiol dioxygenase n=1 Tax=Epidermidibacterium keratini TaxID=1891644 RepID=A0A7L4YRX1_9ACTN|nr:VOC family protein [Epidermidibacterium keratini]QHC01991.1 extradiol dioxygenase [Epidermidibacterium keratini]